MSNLNPVLDSLSIQNQMPPAATGTSKLGKDDFLKLMVEQMKNQDPLSPQDNSAMVAQMAQFSSLESLDNLNTSFSNFASNFSSNQALQASSLVGHSVTVATDSTLYQQGGVISGKTTVTQATPDVNISIYNADTGALVDRIDAGAQAAGDMVFRWDGANFELNGNVVKYGVSGQALPPNGKYRIVADATIDGKAQQLDMALSANVNSVTVDNSGSGKGLILNLAGIGPVSINDVKQFNQ